MNTQDVVTAMEDVFGMKKGYDKNPVALSKFVKVAEELRNARIDTLTPENRDEFEKIAGKYITDRNYKTGTKFGWSDRRQEDGSVTDYKMDIDEDGNLIEESKEEMYDGGGAKRIYTQKNEYNKHGLGMKSEKTERRNNGGISERTTIVTRNPDLITAKVESTEHSGINACVKSAEKIDTITSEVMLRNPYDPSYGSSNSNHEIDTTTLDVRDTVRLHSHMEKIRDEGECDYSLKSFDGKAVLNGKPSLSEYDTRLQPDYTHTPDFDLTYNGNEAFRETVNDRGLRPDLEKRVKTSKIKEIYDKVKDKIKSVIEKFTKRTKDEQTQSKDMM